MISTFLGVLGAMLFVSDQINSFWKNSVWVFAATAGTIFLFDCYDHELFGAGMSFFTSSSPMSIGISAVIVCVAALNLVLDFEFMKGSQSGAPKYMEWFGAFGLMVTLVWLYMEMLRLLAKCATVDDAVSLLANIGSSSWSSYFS